MLLRTLGIFELDGLDFSQPQPLLILSYLCLEGKTSRQTLQRLFWSEQTDAKKRSKSLHTALERLLELNLVRENGTGLETAVACDAELFSEAALTVGEKALEFYRGPFLDGLESHGRLRLGAEAQRWLLEKREELHERWTQFLLEAAELKRDQQQLNDAATFAWRAFKEAQKINYPEEKTMRRIYGLLLEAGQKRKAEKVKGEAETVYGVQWQKVSPLPEGSKIFVGREEERKALRQILLRESHSFVTLTGLGGVGKTELAMVVAKDLQYQFSKVAFVPLESFPSSTPDTTLLLKIAASFGLELAGRVTANAIARELDHEPVLLVLDNAEHLTHLKVTLERLIQHCSTLEILVTSRRALDVAAEYVFALEGLPLPLTPEATLGEGAATRLFLELCQAKGVDVTSQKQDVLELCQAVAGLPLALHLAAPWATVLSVAEIVKQLGGDLDLLGEDARGGKERHLNIRTVFDVSLQHLTLSEQNTLTALGIFEGRFSFASANSILDVSLRTLKGFIRSSLLRFYPSEATYDFHPLLGQYLEDKLRGDAEKVQHLQTTHATYYLAQLARKDESQKRETRERLVKESANVFASWRYVIGQNDWTTLYELAPSLETFCDETAQHSEGLSLFTETISATTLGGAPLGRMLACLAWLEMRLGLTPQVQHHAQKALHLLGSDDIASCSSCYIALASTYEEAGEFEKARDAFLAELALHPLASPEATSSLMNLATLLLQLGDCVGVEEALEKAAANCAEDKPLRLEFIRSRLLLEQGKALQARVLLEWLLQRVQEEKLAHWHKTIEAQLAQVLLSLGDVEKSAWLAQKLLETYDTDRWLRAKMQLVLGDVAASKQNFENALQYYNDSLRTVLPTQSVPAFLLRLSRLGKALLLCGEITLGERLVRYCKNPKQFCRMSFVDRLSLDKAVVSPKSVEEPSKDWHSLEPAEVTLLVVSDVDYILQKINKGETPLALVG